MNEIAKCLNVIGFRFKNSFDKLNKFASADSSSLVKTKFRSKLFIENVFDSPSDSRVWLVNVFDGMLDLLASVERWPESRYGEKPVESYLLVCGWLHSFQSVEFRKELLIVPNN